MDENRTLKYRIIMDLEPKRHLVFFENYVIIKCRSYFYFETVQL